MCCVGMYCDCGRHAQICGPRINSRLMLWCERDKFASRRVRLKLSTNWILEPLMLMNTRNDHLCFSTVRAKHDSGAATKLEPKQKAGNKEKGYGKEQGKNNGRSKNSSSSGSVGKGGASIEDDAGTAQGFAVLAGLKAQLLQNSNKFENLSTYSHPASNAEARTVTNQEIFKLPSPLYLKKNVKPFAENVAKKLPKKIFDSNIKGKHCGKPPSEAKIHLCLSNLPAQLTEKEFNEIMRSVPGLSSWKLMVNETGTCHGYGVCELDKHSDGDMSVEILSRMCIYGNPIFVNFSDPEIARGSYTQQSVDDQISNLPSNLQNPSNIMKEQARAGNIENQTVTSPHSFTEDKQLSEIRGVSNMEIDIDFQLFKAALPPPPHVLEKKTANHSLLKGQTILEAIQKATIERSKLSRRSKRVSRKAKNIIDNEFKDEDNYVGQVQPISINPEWASELERLEASLAALKKLL